MSGAGPSILDAVDEAARRAASDARYGGGLCAAELHQLDLELWVNVGVEDVSERDPKRLTRLLPNGVVGVELKVGDKSAYFKPSVALTSGLTTPELLLGRLARKAGLPRGAWRRPTAKLSRTIWRHFVLDQGERGGFPDAVGGAGYQNRSHLVNLPRRLPGSACQSAAHRRAGR